MKILDSIEYLKEYIIPKITILKKKNKVVLHPVCSLQKMALNTVFYHVAKHFSEQVEVPLNTGCCGMAGDRGFLFPELTASATLREANEVRSKEYEGYYSSSKPCEMALSESVNKNYESILYLVDEVTI